jgi:hypothetical protein
LSVSIIARLAKQGAQTSRQQSMGLRAFKEISLPVLGLMMLVGQNADYASVSKEGAQVSS